MKPYKYKQSRQFQILNRKDGKIALGIYEQYQNVDFRPDATNKRLFWGRLLV